MPLTKTTPRLPEKRFCCQKCTYKTDRSANLARHSKQHDKPEKEDLTSLDPGNLSDIYGEEEVDYADVSSDSLSDLSGSEDADERNSEKSEPLPGTSSEGLEEGRTYRKPTQPAPVAAPVRKMPPSRPEAPRPPTAGEGALAYARKPEHCIPKKVSKDAQTAPAKKSASVSYSSKDEATQTEVVKRRRITWVCRKYKEGRKNVEEVEWEEEEFY